MSKVEINGKAYPCYMTAGAMLRFKQATKKEVSEMTDSFEDMLTLCWSCVASASKREGVPFDYSLEDFADNTLLSDIQNWEAELRAEAEGDNDAANGEKKSR